MVSSRRTKIIALTVIGVPVGAVALASAFAPKDEMRRNLYPDQGACERDYSRQECEPKSGTGTNTSTGSGTSHTTSTGHGMGGWWLGPLYYASRAASGASGDPGAGRTGQITRTETSMRGGFGSFARSMRTAG